MFEYQSELQKIHTAKVPCPPASASAVDVAAYRWVKNPMTEGCFFPVAIKNPPRLHALSGPSEQCACWGISMHSTKDKSINAFLALEKTVRKARKLFGDHTAHGALTGAHGSSTPAALNGHFTFHPNKNAALLWHFTVVQAIP